MRKERKERKAREAQEPESYYGRIHPLPEHRKWAREQAEKPVASGTGMWASKEEQRMAETRARYANEPAPRRRSPPRLPSPRRREKSKSKKRSKTRSRTPSRGWSPPDESPGPSPPRPRC